jgi:hypothetical protein
MRLAVAWLFLERPRRRDLGFPELGERERTRLAECWLKLMAEM